MTYLLNLDYKASKDSIQLRKGLCAPPYQRQPKWQTATSKVQQDE